MDWLRLNALAVGSLSTTILLGVITGYLVVLRGKRRETWWLAGYLGGLFLLLLAYTARYSIFSIAALATGQLSNVIVFGAACLVQFAYSFGGNPFPRESRIVLIVSLTASAVVWGMLFLPGRYGAVYDFNAEYFTYEFGPAVSILAFAEYLWALVVFTRRAVAPIGPAAPDPLRTPVRLLHPDGTLARSHRSFALLTAATLPIALQYVLFQTGVIPRATYALVFNTGSLLICLFIFVVYINNAPHPTSFVVKLVGLPLAVILVAFGIASNMLMPVVERTIMDRYRTEARLADIAVESQRLSRLPSDVAYLLPTSSALDTLRYGSPQEFRPGDLLRRAVPAGGTEPDEAFAARFHYYSLADTSTYFLSFPLLHGGERYSVGFSYADYRLLVHQFASKLAIAVLSAFAIVVAAFPVFFRRGLLNPLRNLLDAVGRVRRGDFRERVETVTDDEIGRLSEGYNRMIEALESMEGNFKALTENAYDAILILSERGEILFANERAGELLGRSPGRLHGVRVARFIDGLSLAAVPERTTKEAIVLRGDRSSVPVEIAVVQTRWESMPARVIVIRDVSARKHAEEMVRAQQLELMRIEKLSSLGELVAAVAHEVNNPNHVVSAGARFIEDSIPALFALAETSPELDPRVRIGGKPYSDFKKSCREVISDIGKSAQRVDHIVRELKRYVRGSAPRRSPIDVNEVVASVLDFARYSVEQASTCFSLELADAPLPVCGDFVELEQVVLNLLENARQALPSEGGEVTLRTLLDRGTREVRLEIADNGAGMSAGVLAHATEPFVTSRSGDGGTGLGLSVVSRIVGNHGGSLSFDSSLGVGTRAIVRLPWLAEGPGERG